ncbi:MAG: hypothetical protein HY092_01505 [Candidatus Kerfeldbacteria bacterium]|nr:hypothetical protein [Candidatus Kerfeldbacteria bacterium]
MILRFPLPDQPIRVVLQRAGYVEFRDPRSGEVSFVRRLGTHFYPRFHLYAEESTADLRLNLHLDQKQPSYQGFTKHSGEYDGSTVEREAARINQAIAGS